MDAVEMDELSGVPDLPVEDSQGEADVSETPQAEPQTLDLTQTELWRSAQAAYDRRVAEAEARARRAEEQAELLAQRTASLEQAIDESLDPDQAAIARERIVQKAKDDELAILKRERWTTWWEKAAMDVGIDPNDPEFRQALWDAQRAGNNAPLQVKIEVARQLNTVRQVPKPATPVATTTEDTMPGNKPKTDGYVLPPSGKSMARGESRIAEINEELLGLMNDYTRNLPRINALKAERDKLTKGG